MDPAIEANPPDFGCRLVWEDYDEVALAIYNTMRFWRHLENREAFKNSYGLGRNAFEVLVASSISATVQANFEIERKSLDDKAKLMPWHRKLGRAIRHAYRVLRLWNT